jgi:hypothetical protein
MKKLIILVSILGIIVGTNFPVQAGIPENYTEVNTVIDSTSSAPLTTWSLTVTILDAEKDCPAQDCDLLILVWGANNDCETVSSILLDYTSYTSGTAIYYLGGSTNFTYAYIEIYDVNGDCDYNHNTCCKAIGPSMRCDLNVCRE